MYDHVVGLSSVFCISWLRSVLVAFDLLDPLLQRFVVGEFRNAFLVGGDGVVVSPQGVERCCQDGAKCGNAVVVRRVGAILNKRMLHS
jgi:hypothetical protein